MLKGIKINTVKFYAIIFIFCIIVLLLFCVKVGVNGGLCNTDDEIAADTRKDIEKTAITFVEALTKFENSEAYLLLDKNITQSMTKDAFATAVKQMIPANTSFQNLHIAHTYLDTEARIGGTSPTFANCTEVAHGTISKPVFVEARLSKQAYVIVEGDTKNNKIAFVLWLIPENKKWSVEYFQPFAADMVGRSPEYLWALGQQEKNKHHNFNAYVLSITALQLTNRGPHFQLGIQSKFAEGIKALEVPKEFFGKPPFILKSSNKSFKILSIGPTGVNKKNLLNNSPRN